MHYFKEKPTFRVITANFQVSEILGILRYIDYKYTYMHVYACIWKCHWIKIGLKVMLINNFLTESLNTYKDPYPEFSETLWIK